jgi:hypothetical protein
MIKSRMMRGAGHAPRLREKRNAYRILVGKPEGKRQLGRPIRRWEYYIRIDLREIYIMRWYGLDFYNSGYGLVEGSCEHVNEPSGSIKCFEILE